MPKHRGGYTTYVCIYVHTYFTDSVLVGRVVFRLQRRDRMNWKKENKKGGRIIVVYTFSGASYCN